MSNAFTTAIDAVLISTHASTVVAVPDFGSDISCTDDSDALFSELAGDDPRLVAESCWRTLSSPRGSIPGAPEEGYDLQQLLRSPANPSTWPGLVRAALANDDRIASLDVRFKQIASDEWELRIDGETVDGGAFELVGTLTADGALLQEILA